MQIKNNTISFDFDGTLDDNFDGVKNPYKKEVRDFALRLIRRGYNVHIITRRYGPDNSVLGLMDEHIKVWNVAKELGIPRENIIFTNRNWKYSSIASIGACIHIDDDEREKFWLDRHLPNVKMICLTNENWQEELIEQIDKHNKFNIWFGNEKNMFKLGTALFLILLTIFLFS